MFRNFLKLFGNFLCFETFQTVWKLFVLRKFLIRFPALFGNFLGSRNFFKLIAKFCVPEIFLIRFPALFGNFLGSRNFFKLIAKFCVPEIFLIRFPALFESNIVHENLVLTLLKNLSKFR